MKNTDTLQNLEAVEIGTGNFLFSEGAVSRSDAQAKGYTDFGNIKAFTNLSKATTAQIVQSYQGIRRVARNIPTLIERGYKLVSEESDFLKLKFANFGKDATAFTQGALAAANGDVLGFTAVPAVIGAWYELLYTGVAVRELSAVTIAGKVEGTDFVLDKKRGLIRFLTAQAANLTPVLTAPAVAAGDPGYLKAMKPGQIALLRGYARLTCYDQDSNSIVAWDHKAFKCEISLSNQPDHDGEKPSSIELMVTIIADGDDLFVREY